MSMRYEDLPVDFQEKIASNAGIMLRDFNPATGEFSTADIVCATSGGLSISAVTSYIDRFADVDNCIPNSKEGKQIDDVEVKISGTAVTVDTALVKALVGAADVGTVDTTKVTPRSQLSLGDYATYYFVTAYGDKTGPTNGGFICVKILNGLSTGGFALQTEKKANSQLAFEFMAHRSIYTPDTMPYEIYIHEGTSEAGDFLLEFASAAGTLTGDTALSGMTETPSAGESYVYQTGYGLVLPAAGQILAGSAWTAWNGSDDITATTGMDIILAVILTATGAAQHAGKSTVVANEA
jgi:hypothetical protein